MHEIAHFIMCFVSEVKITPVSQSDNYIHVVDWGQYWRNVISTVHQRCAGSSTLVLFFWTFPHFCFKLFHKMKLVIFYIQCWCNTISPAIIYMFSSFALLDMITDKSHLLVFTLTTYLQQPTVIQIQTTMQLTLTLTTTLVTFLSTLIKGLLFCRSLLLGLSLCQYVCTCIIKCCRNNYLRGERYNLLKKGGGLERVHKVC